MRLCSTLLLCLLAPATLAQPFDTAFGFGGPNSDVAEDVALDDAGRTYVAGTFEGTIDFGNGVSITSAGDSDAFLVAFDAEGTALWARRGGTDVFNDFGEAVAVAADGSVYWAGFFTGVATWDGGANPDAEVEVFSDFDAFLAKYDAGGNLLWVRQAGGVDQDTGDGVAVDFAGNAYLVGGFEGAGTFGGETLTSSGSSDGFIAKYDPDGNVLWARQAGGADGDKTYDVALGNAGDPVVVGQFRGVATFGAIPLQSAGQTDVYVVRYSGADGTVQWASQIGADGAEYGRGVAVTAAGTVYATGGFENSILVGSDVLTSAGFTDVFVAQLDPDGGLVWGRRAGGDGFDFGESVATNSVYAYATGYVDGDGTFGDEPFTTAGGQDGYLLAYDPAGNLNEAAVIGGTNRDNGTGIGVNIEADVYALAGFFRGTIAPGGQPLTSAGSNDGFVVQNPLFGLAGAEDAAPSAAFALSAAVPNPAHGRTAFSLTLDRPLDVTVAVFDVLGRRVAVLHDGPLAAGGHDLTWEPGPLPSGLYVVHAVADGHVRARRVTLLR